MNVDLSEVSDPRDRAVLEGVVVQLDGLLSTAQVVLQRDLATLIREDRHAVLAAVAKTNAADTAMELIAAALLEMAERIGPQGGRLNYYLNRGEGPNPVRKKKRIERYRTILKEKR